MTDLSGMNMKFAVMKLADARHLSESEQIQLVHLLDKVEAGRKAEGKKDNTYLVVNTDEPYSEEVVEVLKRNGHWN